MKQEKEKNIILEHLKQIPIVELACKKSGVSRATFYRWKKDDAEFARAADEAISSGRSFISDLAESGLIGHIKDRNLVAIMHWLKTHNKAYKEKVEISFNKEAVDKALDQIKKIIEEQ